MRATEGATPQMTLTSKLLCVPHPSLSKCSICPAKLVGRPEASKRLIGLTPLLPSSKLQAPCCSHGHSLGCWPVEEGSRRYIGPSLPPFLTLSYCYSLPEEGGSQEGGKELGEGKTAGRKGGRGEQQDEGRAGRRQQARRPSTHAHGQLQKDWTAPLA